MFVAILHTWKPTVKKLRWECSKSSTKWIKSTSWTARAKWNTPLREFPGIRFPLDLTFLHPCIKTSWRPKPSVQFSEASVVNWSNARTLDLSLLSCESHFRLSHSLFQPHPGAVDTPQFSAWLWLLDGHDQLISSMFQGTLLCFRSLGKLLQQNSHVKGFWGPLLSVFKVTPFTLEFLKLLKNILTKVGRWDLWF